MAAARPRWAAQAGAAVRVEFTDTGQHRQVGSVLLVGWRVEVLHMEGGDLLLP